MSSGGAAHRGPRSADRRGRRRREPATRRAIHRRRRRRPPAHGPGLVSPFGAHSYGRSIESRSARSGRARGARSSTSAPSNSSRAAPVRHATRAGIARHYRCRTAGRRPAVALNSLTATGLIVTVWTHRRRVGHSLVPPTRPATPSARIPAAARKSSARGPTPSAGAPSPVEVLCAELAHRGAQRLLLGANRTRALALSHF